MNKLTSLAIVLVALMAVSLQCASADLEDADRRLFDHRDHLHTLLGRGRCKSTPNNDEDVCVKVVDRYKTAKTITFTNERCAKAAKEFSQDIRFVHCHKGKCQKDSLNECL